MTLAMERAVVSAGPRSSRRTRSLRVNSCLVRDIQVGFPLHRQTVGHNGDRCNFGRQDVVIVIKLIINGLRSSAAAL